MRPAPTPMTGGLVGCIPTYKIAGAAAAEGKAWRKWLPLRSGLRDNMATPGRSCIRSDPSGNRKPACGSG